jgi:hypothetical protein
LRTVVTVDVYAYPNDTPKYWAVSIDEPLDDNFVKIQPEKIWIYGEAQLEEIYDLPYGTHTITVGVDTPPEKPWLVQVWINEDSLTGGQYIPVSRGNFLQRTFTVTSDAPYLTAQIPRNVQALNPITGLCQIILEYETPSLYNWYGCHNEYKLGYGYTRGYIVQYTHYEYLINPNPPEQFIPAAWFWTNGGEPAPKAARSIFWWRMVKDAANLTSEYWTAIPQQPKKYDPSVKLCWPLAEVGLPPWYLTDTVPEGETATFIVGHVENDTAPRDQWNYVVDDTVTFTIRTSSSCRNPPPSTPKIRITNYAVYPFVPIDNARPGRLNLVLAELQNIGTTGIAWPFIKVKEDFAYTHTIYPGNINFSAPISIGEKVTFNMLVTLTPTMVSQGYFTLQAGHFEGQLSGRIMAPMTPVVDQEIQVPLQQPTLMANIRSLALSHTAAPIAAKIQSLALTHTPSPIAAKIQSLTLATAPSPVAAKIQSLTLSHTPPPPPPPPLATFSLGGKVLSLLGPVADAEVTLNGFSTKTGRDGSFYITNIPEGTYTLTVKPTRIHERLLLKSVTQKIDIYMDTSKIINLPLNWTNLGIGAASTAAIGAVLSARKKPKPPTW